MNKKNPANRGRRTGENLNWMSKFNENNGHYFTFPLKLLWVKDPTKYKQAIQDCIDYSIYKFMKSGKCGEGDGSSKLERAHELLHFSGGDIGTICETGRRITQTINPGDIYTSVKTSYLFDARDGKFQIELLLLVAAVKSIIGHKRNFTNTNMLFILRRMYGRDYTMSRHKFNKLKDNALSRRILTIIPASRGYYVSIRYSASELKEAVIQRITKYESKKIEAAQAGKDIAILRRQLKAPNQRIPKTAP